MSISLLLLPEVLLVEFVLLLAQRECVRDFQGIGSNVRCDASTFLPPSVAVMVYDNSAAAAIEAKRSGSSLIVREVMKLSLVSRRETTVWLTISQLLAAMNKRQQHHDGNGNS